MPMPHSQDDPLASLPQEVRAQLREGYLDEASPLVDDLETALLGLERAPDDEAVMAAAFRAAHTIKGSAASVGLRPIAVFTHEVENVLDALRGQQLPPRASRADRAPIVRRCAARVSRRLRHDAAPPDVRRLPGNAFRGVSRGATTGAGMRICAGDRRTCPHQTTRAHDATLGLLDRLPQAERLRLRDALRGGAGAYHIRFVPPDRCVPPRPGSAGAACTPSARRRRSSVRRCCWTDCRRWKTWTRRPATSVSRRWPSASNRQADLRDVFAFCAADTMVDIEPSNTSRVAGDRPQRPGTAPEADRRRTETTGRDSARGRAGKCSGSRACAGQATASGRDPGGGEPGQSRRRPARASQASGAGQGRRARSGDDGRVIRVKQARLDGLINLVGELVTARNAMLHLEQFVEAEFADPRLSRRMKETTTLVSKAVGQLQTDVLSLRMVPVHTVFQRLPRVVRDVTVRQGKQVDLRFSGDSTELDKTVADALFDPLVHLVRNAVDHGVEAPDVRRAAGKSEAGQLDYRRLAPGQRGAWWRSATTAPASTGLGSSPRQWRKA